VARKPTMLALLSAMLSVPRKPPRIRLATALVSKDHPSLQLDTVVPDASLAWTTFSSGWDCEANGCVTPSSQGECEDAMRALTTRSKLTGVKNYDERDYNFPRCFTKADSSTPASDDKIFYNSGATTGACGSSGYNCACQCPIPRRRCRRRRRPPRHSRGRPSRAGRIAKPMAASRRAQRRSARTRCAP